MGYERFIFWFWESQKTGWYACKVKKRFLIICIYLYLICTMTPKRFAQWFIFPNPTFAWRYSAVIDPNGWFHLKQCLWAQCCFVYSRYRGKAIFNTLYTQCTFRFKTLQDVFIHLELCYTLHERSFSKIHNWGTLKAASWWSRYFTYAAAYICNHLWYAILHMQSLFHYVWSRHSEDVKESQNMESWKIKSHK